MLTSVELPLTPDYDPRRVEGAELEDALSRARAAEQAAALTPRDKLARMAGATGDISGLMTEDRLNAIGALVCEEYEIDRNDEKDWRETVEDALKLASQSHESAKKDYPWPDASNVRFPILTTAALQFNARAYPAIVKGDEAVAVKVVGKDAGRPRMVDGVPLVKVPTGEEGPISALPPEAQAMAQPVWEVEPGAKSARAQRVSSYLNTTIFYRMQDWESDTDSLLIQLPIVGCAFRKVWFDADEGIQRTALVPAVRVVAPCGARSVDTTPRLTEEVPDVYPGVISERMRSGYYREVEIDTKEHDAGRLLLEQQRFMDLDGDKVDEPYIVTVDHESQKVLRIEPNFGPQDIKFVPGPNDIERVVSIKRGKFFIKYDFFPHPEGKFKGIGLGHLLKQLGDVIDTAINQLVDAGHAQTAGGGFVGSGVRLQARGGGSVIKYRPGEYKTVDVPGDQLRNAIVERTLPNVSPVTFQVLDLILGAARDVAGVKDVLTGEASNNGQVGTTLALIDQGLQVFNAVYKRVYRSLKEEFQLLFENVGKYGGEAAAADYQNVLDDPAANFEADFQSQDFDIRPVSDPSSVTKMQKVAKAQFIMGTLEALVAAGGNPREAMLRVYQAADIDDIDKLFPEPTPQAPDPRAEAQAKAMEAKAMRDLAAAGKDGATAEQTKFETQMGAMTAGMEMGAAGMADAPVI